MFGHLRSGKKSDLILLPDTRIPGNWEYFLRHDGNKIEFLATRISNLNISDGKYVLSTKGVDVGSTDGSRKHRWM